MGEKNRNFRVGACKQDWEMDEIQGQEDQREGS